MAAFSTSFGAWVGLVKETTWGTAVSPRTNFLRVISSTLSRRVRNRPTADLGYAGQASRNTRSHFLERDESGGTITTVLSYDDSSVFLLDQLFGATANSGAGPYTHTLTLASPGRTGFTCEHALGDSGKSLVFEGCVITKGTIAARFGEQMTLAVDVIAQTNSGLASSATPTLNSSNHEMLHSHVGSLTLASITVPMVEFELTIDRHKERRNALGDATTAQPSERFLEVTGRFVLEFDPSSNLYAAFLATTQGDGSFTVSDGTRSVAVTLQNLYIEDYDVALQTGAGLIRQSVMFRCESDGTDEGVKLVITNANATELIN